MIYEVAELAKWLKEEDDEQMFGHSPLLITDLMLEQMEIELLEPLCDLSPGGAFL